MRSDRRADRPGVVFCCLCNERGGVVDDAVVWRLAPDRWLSVTTNGRWRTVAWIRDVLAEWDLNAIATDITDGLSALAVQGPRSREVLAGFVGEDVSRENLPVFHCRCTRVAGVQVLVGRCGFIGELGYELYLPTQYGEWLCLRHLDETTARAGGPPCGLWAVVSCGLEKGLTANGIDYDGETSPSRRASASP